MLLGRKDASGVKIGDGNGILNVSSVPFCFALVCRGMKCRSRCCGSGEKEREKENKKNK